MANITSPDITSLDYQHYLLQLAMDSIHHGLTHHQCMAVISPPEKFYTQTLAACFVTLKIGKNLRGCIGTLQAYRPLHEDVIVNAYHSAFDDPRFSPLRKEEFAAITLCISVLTPARKMDFTSEEDLLRQIRPGLDGLILQENSHKATFLPAVWEDLPDAKEFLMHLKNKAGLPMHYWSNTLKIDRYATVSFEHSPS